MYTSGNTSAQVDRRPSLTRRSSDAVSHATKRCKSAITLSETFPPDVLSRRVSREGAHFSHGEWWLAHTKPRQEKALAADLLCRGVAFYLPLVARKSLTRGRARIAHVPLFPGYLFVRGSDEDRIRSLKTNRVLTVHHVPDGEQLRNDLLRFAELIAMAAPLLPEARLVEGVRVRVKAGPFRDKEGVVLQRNGRTRLLLAVNYLQQGASLEIDDCLLERI